jgi:sulfur-oxidizing protein SoxZ
MSRAGEVIEIRTLIEHPMESGIRADGSRPPPRDMLARFVARMNGETVFQAELRNGTSANPYHVFFVRVAAPGEFAFVWTDEAGREARTTARVAVS